MGAKYGALISQIVDQAEIDHLLDYGCGSNLSLTKTLKPKRPFKYQCYDPGVKKYADPPIPADMVVSCDVLEHIEPEFLDDVLDHLQDLTQHILFVSIHTGPAGKVLEDGRNAHLIQQPMEWWLPKLWERFSIQTFQAKNAREFWVVANNMDLPIV
ncbi:MAG: hypothetical protein ACXABY_35610 [Candidatus Thorarchaeota archaeon]|jgi:hypothetical protein